MRTFQTMKARMSLESLWSRWVMTFRRVRDSFLHWKMLNYLWSKRILMNLNSWIVPILQNCKIKNSTFKILMSLICQIIILMVCKIQGIWISIQIRISEMEESSLRSQLIEMITMGKVNNNRHCKACCIQLIFRGVFRHRFKNWFRMIKSLSLMVLWRLKGHSHLITCLMRLNLRLRSLETSVKFLRRILVRRMMLNLGLSKRMTNCVRKIIIGLNGSSSKWMSGRHRSMNLPHSWLGLDKRMQNC